MRLRQQVEALSDEVSFQQEIIAQQKSHLKFKELLLEEQTKSASDSLSKKVNRLCFIEKMFEQEMPKKISEGGARLEGVKEKLRTLKTRLQSSLKTPKVKEEGGSLDQRLLHFEEILRKFN